MKARAFTKEAAVKYEEEKYREKWLMKYLALQKKNQEDHFAAEEAIRNLKSEIQQISDQSHVFSIWPPIL